MFLRIEPTLNSEFRVTWGGSEGSVEPSYSIGQETLRTAAKEVRDELLQLSIWAINGEPEKRKAHLESLAAAGKRLYVRLFRDPAKQAEIARLKQWIADEYENGDRQLNIQADPSLHVPWGLVFDDSSSPADVDVSSDDESLGAIKREMAEYGNFWSLKYVLSVSQRLGKARTELTRARDSFGMLSLLNSDVEEETKDRLGQSRYDEFHEIMGQPIGIAHSLRECYELMKKSDRSDILFHFFGHQAEQTLFLAKNEQISYEDFALLMDDLERFASDKRKDAFGLVFLNGCQTADGKFDFCLVREALRSGLCGVIATESGVRKDFAANFGYQFLKAMVVRGDSVSAAMTRLRRAPDLWPESLLYGCYAHPGYRIQPKSPG